LGHERGAFTGAIVRRPGLLAVADGGTVFIDEVGDLPLDAQVMVLRLLQSGEIRPVGPIQTRRVDVRLIAATPRDLETAIERGTFRDDPGYGLRHVVIDVPPLRERREDIPVLVEYFIEGSTSATASGSAAGRARRSGGLDNTPGAVGRADELGSDPS
jgi:transcriptional regulator with GAF, ATPase, and Fis domain